MLYNSCRLIKSARAVGINFYLIIHFYSVTHILHVHNYHERTMVFQVESDLDFISGPSSIAIGN